MADYFWGAIREKLGAVGSEPLPGQGRPGFLWACNNLALKPLLTFLRAYFLKGGLLKGRGGFSSAVHESVLLFGVNARRYELMAGDKGPLERIRREF
ncbi:MAG: hypothetical protein HY098_03175 [Nitrospinae bacterium]|nr:hypothetical protein [Nitrospinota bacterium]